MIINLTFIFSNCLTNESIKKLEWCNLQSMIDFVKPYLPENPVILEAGAYDGAETAKMKIVWPNSVIYAFEPVPELYHKLTVNTNGLNEVYCIPLALSDKNGFAEFYLSEDINNQGKVSMSSSLLSPKEHITKNPETLFKKKIKVSTITLNEWSYLYDIPKIDFLWLDMQGYELNALKMAPKRLFDTVKVIVTEVEFVEAYTGQYLYQEVRTWLEEQGFVMLARNFDDPSTPDIWFGDAIFVRK